MSGILFLDFETKDRGISAGLGAGWPYKGMVDVIGFAFSMDGKKTKWSTDLGLLRSLLEWCSVLVAHNAAYELGILRMLGIPYEHVEIVDTMLWARLYDNQRMRYGLDDLAASWLGDRKSNDLLAEAARELKLVKSKTQDAVKYAKVNLDVLYAHKPEIVIHYAIQDVDLLVALYRYLLERVPASKFRDILSDLQKVVIDIRSRGILVSVDLLDASQDKLAYELDSITENLKMYIGDGNPNSTAVIVDVLDRLGIKYPMTPKGNPSVTSKWVEAQEGEFFTVLKNYRKLNKLKNDFVDKIKTMIVNAYGETALQPGSIVRLHPELNILAASTGRFSSSNFNMQQLPKRDPYAKPLVRGFVVPEEGETFYSLDFCYDSKTEVLTSEGFKLWENVNDTDLLATYHEDGRISYEKPSRLIKLPYVGNMHRFTGKHLDLLVSPNHRMIRLNQDDRFVEMCASEGPKAGYRNVHAGSYIGGETDPTIRLKAAVQADGTVRRNSSGTINGIRFKLKKARKIQRLLSLLDGLGIVYHTNTPPSWAVDGFSMVYIPTFPGIEDIAVKTFTEDFVRGLSLESREDLLDELRHWDGTGNEVSYRYYTASIETATAVQLAAITSNRRASVSERMTSGGFSDKPQYVVRIGNKNTTYTCKKNYSVEQYAGTIYCATVSTGMLVVRREGKVSVSGNCSQEPRLQVHYAALIGSSGGKELCERWNSDPSFDMHSAVAEICGIERTPAKIINLGLSYGMSTTKLAASLSLSKKQAETLLNQYHDRAPYLKDLIKACKAQLSKNGYVRSLLGRHIKKKDEFFDEETGRTQDYLYTAVNLLIQGSAADQTIAAMVEAYRYGIKIGYPIHDEITASFKDPQDAAILKHIMENCIRLRVHSKSEVTRGDTFANQKDLDVQELEDLDKVKSFKERYVPILSFTK